MPRSKLYAHELQAVVAAATAIRPLEKFIVSAELDGTRGLYCRPQPQCLLKATNDYRAILALLRSKHGLNPDMKAHHKARRRQRDTGVEQGMDWLKALSNTQRAGAPRRDDAAGQAGQPARCGGLPVTRSHPAGVAAARHGTHRCTGRRGPQPSPPGAVQATAGTHGLNRPNPALASRAVDRWTMRCAHKHGPWTTLRVAHRPHLRPPAHSPRPRLRNLKTRVPNTLARSTTDRLASRRRSQVAPGSYPLWKRLYVSAVPETGAGVLLASGLGVLLLMLELGRR